MNRKAIYWCIAAALLGCGATCATVHLTNTETMTIDEAMMLVNKTLTTQQRTVVAAAVRRQVTAGARFLRSIEKEDTSAGREAVAGLEQLRDILK